MALLSCTQDPLQNTDSLRRDDKKSPTISWKSQPKASPSEFIITVDDLDTSHEKVSLSYCFYLADRTIPETLYFKPALFLGPKQWKVILSQEMIGSSLLTFAGPKDFILALKASDGINLPTIEKIPVTISILHPTIKITKNPFDLPTVVEQKDTYLTALQERKPSSEPLVFCKLLIENTSLESIFIKINIKGFIESSLTRFQNTQEVSSEKRVKAPIVVKVNKWNQEGKIVRVDSLNMEGHHELIYELDPHTKSKGLIVSVLTNLNFSDDVFLGREYPNLNPNTFIYHLIFSGNKFNVLSAPKGLSQEFYALESNWNDLSPKELPDIKFVTHP